MNRNRRILMIFIMAAGAAIVSLGWAETASANGDIPEIGEAITGDLPQMENFVGGEDALYSGCVRLDTAPQNAVFEQRVVELVNIERSKIGVAPLKRNSDLDYAARYHARDMVEDDYNPLSHDTLDRVNGTLNYVCGAFTRIQLYYRNYYAAGENIAAGFDTPEDVVKGWMGSDGHRRNILDPKYREIGIGFYQGNALFREYWVMDLVGKADVYPVVINNEVELTKTPNVSLYVYGREQWSEMRVQYNQSNWSGWMPFKDTFNWQLDPTGGVHTLTVEMKQAGSLLAEAVSSDSIILSGYTPKQYDYSLFLPTIVR